MLPASETALRQFVIFGAGVGQAAITYSLHTFTGWAYHVMWAVDMVLIFKCIQLLIAEGRERAERERRQAPVGSGEDVLGAVAASHCSITSCSSSVMACQQ